MALSQNKLQHVLWGSMIKYSRTPEGWLWSLYLCSSHSSCITNFSTISLNAQCVPNAASNILFTGILNICSILLTEMQCQAQPVGYDQTLLLTHRGAGRRTNQHTSLLKKAGHEDCNLYIQQDLDINMFVINIQIKSTAKVFNQRQTTVHIFSYQSQLVQDITKTHLWTNSCPLLD